MEVRGGRLVLGGIDAEELVERFGSPLFVIEEAVLRRQARRLVEAFRGEATLLFAGKANPNLRVWQVMREEGLGLDCCSPGEVWLGLKAGYVPEEISFTGTALSVEDIDELAASGARVNLDASSQLRRWGCRHPGKPVGLRVNPGIGIGLHEHCTTGGEESKLGVSLEEMRAAPELARECGVPLRGVHAHLGSGGLEVAPFLEMAKELFRLAVELDAPIEYVDVGGGIGVPHAPGDPPFPLEEYAAGLGRLRREAESRRDSGGAVELVVEPGQWLVAEAGWLLTRVQALKERSDGKRFALVDSSSNHYPGPAIYGSYHEFYKVGSMEAERTRLYDLCGNLCNTGDTLARCRPMPSLAEGDVLGMVNAGAYGMSRASTYNSRPLPAEVMVSEGEARVIRRRQTYEDLLLWQE